VSLISTSEAKTFLRVSASELDAEVALMMAGLEEWVERYCGFALTSAEVEDESVDGGGLLLDLARKPVTSVASVTDAEDDVVWDTDHYQLVDGRGVLRVDDRGARWAGGYLRWLVTYTGGYTAETAPAGLKPLLLSLLHRAWNARGDVPFRMESGASVNWRALAEGDVLEMLEVYRLGAKVM